MANDEERTSNLVTNIAYIDLFWMLHSSIFTFELIHEGSCEPGFSTLEGALMAMMMMMGRRKN